MTSLSLQQVDYQEPANFWFGPRAADLIHLGAKFAPCMRRDIKILKEIDVWRERERDTACCIRNDDSGCVQSSKADCSVSCYLALSPEHVSQSLLLSESCVYNIIFSFANQLVRGLRSTATVNVCATSHLYLFARACVKIQFTIFPFVSISRACIHLFSEFLISTRYSSSFSSGVFCAAM